MKMAFNMLVKTCLHSRLSFKGDSVDISFSRDKEYKDEKVLFFIIDENNNTNSKMRRYLADSKGRPHEGKLCDLLIYYSRDDLQNDVICFVELKKNKADEKEAIEQVIETNNLFRKKYRNNYGKNMKWAAYIHYPNHGSSQMNNKEKRDLLQDRFDKWQCSTINDIGSFIRACV